MLARFISREFNQLINFIPVLFGIGIGVYFSLGDETYVPYVACALLLPIGLLINDRLKIIGIVFLLILAGFFTAWTRTYLVDTYMLHEKIKYANFTATVITSEATPRGIKFIVSDVEMKNSKSRLNKLSLTWRTDRNISYDYNPGDKLLFSAILDPILPKAFENAYDFRKQAYFNGISAKGYLLKPPKILNKTKNSCAINNIRQRIDQLIDSNLEGQKSAIVKALITGNKSSLSPQTRENFSDAGIAHVLAISGLHIGIIAGFFFVIIRLFLCMFCPIVALKYDIKKISALLSLLCVYVYVQISGEAIPAVRSFIMYSIFASAVLFGRRALSMRSVSVAALVILVFRPEAMLFPSFQMSFSAVVALVAFYERYNQRYNQGIIFPLLFSSIIASAATAIFSVNTFNRLSLGGVISNLAAVPMMTFIIMPLCIISLVFALINFNHIFNILGWFINILIKLSQFISNMEYSSFTLPTPDATSFILVVLGGLCLSIFSSRVKWFGGLLIFSGISVYFAQSRPIIYVSESNKIIGVNCGKCMCFNNLSFLRKASSAFATSEAITCKRKFSHRDCRKCVKKIGDGIFYTNGFYIIDRNTNKAAQVRNHLVIELNNSSLTPPRTIYKDGSIKWHIKPNRPWN